MEEIGRIVNAAALRKTARKESGQSSECRDIRGQMKIRARERITNAAALSIGCRGIGPEAEKN